MKQSGAVCSQKPLSFPMIEQEDGMRNDKAQTRGPTRAPGPSPSDLHFIFHYQDEYYSRAHSSYHPLLNIPVYIFTL